MVMVSQYDKENNSEKGIFIKSREKSICPICGGKLSVRDSRKRTCYHEDGTRKKYRLRRLKCKQCTKIHTELPDFMQPFKRYEAKVVEDVLDDKGRSCPAEECTIRQWRGWFCNRTALFEAKLRSLKQRLEGSPDNILYPSSLLQEIRSTGIGWLSRLTRQLVNSENEIHTCFAFCH